MAEDMPGVTVVVPTLNRGTYLLDTVRDLLAQTHRPLEILIVDQSDRGWPELEALVVANPDVISHHRVSFRGLPIARNFGWQRARHELIVYVDDDIRCGPAFARGYADTLTRGDADIVGGGIDGDLECVRPRPGTFNRWRAAPEAGFASVDSGAADHVRGCNFGVRRELLRRIGGFDKRLDVGAALHEETEMMLRAAEAGAGVRFEGSLRLTHLAAGGGGTRQTDWRCYVFALTHNRSIVSRRHSRRYQWPVALAWSGRLVLAYALHERDPRLVVAGVRGMVEGWRAGGLPPLCGRFESDRT